MSYKPYVFLLRDEDDIDHLDKFRKKMNDPEYENVRIEFFYRVDKDWSFRYESNKPTLKKGDILAAITVDRGNLWDALTNESGVYDAKQCHAEKRFPKFFRADELPRQKTEPGSGILLKDMTIMDIEPNRLWKSKIKKSIGIPDVC